MHYTTLHSSNSERKTSPYGFLCNSSELYKPQSTGQAGPVVAHKMQGKSVIVNNNSPVTFIGATTFRLYSIDNYGKIGWLISYAHKNYVSQSEVHPLAAMPKTRGLDSVNFSLYDSLLYIITSEETIY